MESDLSSPKFEWFASDLLPRDPCPPDTVIAIGQACLLT